MAINKKKDVGFSLLCCGLVTGLAISAKAAGNEYLDLDITQLMDITITSVAKKEQRLSDAAAAIFVITQEDIRRSGVTHVAEALAMAPGIQVAQISASKWSISSRGFAGYTSNKLLVLIDGRSVYSPAYSGTFWDMQNVLLEDVDRIEVIRGPGGTLWGANAVNGVINIITKKAGDTQGGLLRAGVGNQEKIQAAARYGAALSPSIDGRLYASYHDRDSNMLKEGGGDANDGWQSFQTGFRVDGQPGDTSDWTLQGDVYQNNEDQVTFPYWVETPPYLTANYGDVEASGANLLGRYTREYSADQVLTVQAYYDYSDRQDDFYQQTFSTLDLDVQYQANMGESNALTLGGGYRFVDGEFTESFQVSLPNSTDSLYNAFAQDEINLIDDRLWLTLGVKWEHNDYTGSEWQPSGRLLWKPKEKHSLWASIARAVRTPSIVERKGGIVIGVFPTPMGIGTAQVRGNDNFESEELIAYEAGYRWQATEDLSFDVATFYNDYSKLYSISSTPSLTGADLNFINGVGGEGKGLEIVVEWQTATWLSLIGTYSYLDLEFDQDDPISTGEVDDFIVKASPKNQASIRSAIDFFDNWQLNFWLRYIDEITGRQSSDLLSSSIALESYFLFDANLIWTPKKNLELMVAGQNLFSGSQLQYISEFVTPPTEIERSVYAKLTYRF